MYKSFSDTLSVVYCFVISTQSRINPAVELAESSHEFFASLHEIGSWKFGESSIKWYYHRPTSKAFGNIFSFRCIREWVSITSCINMLCRVLVRTRYNIQSIPIKNQKDNGFGANGQYGCLNGLRLNTYACSLMRS